LGSLAPDNPIWIRFARGMAPAVAPLAAMVAQQAGAPPPRKILDIAAGHGLYGIAFATRFPGCHATGLDWDTVIAVARENAARAGIADRYATIAGSAFEVPWGDGYDRVLVPNFLHHFDTAACVGLLRRAHAALRPGGSVVIVEFVPDADRVSPPRAATFAMTALLTTPGGTAYTAAELAGMLAEAGFEPPVVTPLPPTPATLLMARRP
jgi:cyclopropane fatty-acyl-phospholipid synthase-like methyltransferase